MQAKILVFGEKFIGQTKLVEKLAYPEATFSTKYRRTFGVDYTCARIDSTTLNIWDVASDAPLGGAFYFGTDIVIYGIDLSTPYLNEEKIDAAIANIRHYTSHREKQIPIILVGTKADEAREYSEKQFAQLLANPKYNFKEGIKTSSREKTNIYTLRDRLCEIVKELKGNLTVANHNHSFFKEAEREETSAGEEMGWVLSCLEIGILACIPVIGWTILLVYFGCKSCCNDEDNENSLSS